MILWLIIFISIAVISQSILIVDLPGSKDAKIKQHHGYLRFIHNHNIHFWFVESQNIPAKDPILLWLTGGPGCSGLFALFTEIGPYFITPNGSTLVENPYSWTNVVNLLIFESPVGVGFSDLPIETLNLDDNATASGHLQALLHFYEQFPQFQKNALYLGGESYAGMYIPFLIEKIFDNETEHNVTVKGIIIGNALVDVELWLSTIIPFAYYHGFVDESLWRNAVEECCNGSLLDCHFDNGAKFCDFFAAAVRDDVWNGQLYRYSMYADCSETKVKPKPPAGWRRRSRRSLTTEKEQKKIFNFIEPKIVLKNQEHEAVKDWLTCNAIDAVTTYLNREDVQKVLFPNRNPRTWNACSDIARQIYKRYVGNVHSQLQMALDNGIVVLLYYGNTDLTCNFLIGEKFAYRLGYQVTTFKQSFSVNGKLGGFKTKYGNLELVVVQGAGHMVPSEKPEVALFLLKEFINRTYHTNYSIRNGFAFDWKKESWLMQKLVAAENCPQTAKTSPKSSKSHHVISYYIYFFLYISCSWSMLFMKC